VKVAIIQSNYLPWKGYFDIIHDVDVFVFLEDVQYTKNDWRNRNKIKTPTGVQWLTVPMLKGIHQKIFKAKIDNFQQWKIKHKKSIECNYAASLYYDDYKDDIFKIYTKKFNTISELNMYTIKKICKMLNIKTRFVNSRDLHTTEKKDKKVIEICQQVNADYYLSGPAAKDYIHNDNFINNGIELVYKDYSGYPKYQQLWGDFSHYVSIIDVIFNCGKDVPFYIWGWRD